MSSPPRIRPATRALVTDRAGHVLLVHFDFPWDPELPTGLWACPGGGIDPGESLSAALRRELWEELGLAYDADPGRPVWVKEHLFPMSLEGGRWDGQHDTYFWVEVDRFEPRPHFTVEELRAENVVGLRWWSPAELRQAQAAYDADRRDDPAYVVFSPRRLAHLMADLFAAGRPETPRQLDPR